MTFIVHHLTLNIHFATYILIEHCFFIISTISILKQHFGFINWLLGRLLVSNEKIIFLEIKLCEIVFRPHLSGYNVLEPSKFLGSNWEVFDFKISHQGCDITYVSAQRCHKNVFQDAEHFQTKIISSESYF